MLSFLNNLKYKNKAYICDNFKLYEVLFVTDNSESFIFNCTDGSKRGVDLAASYFLYSNGWINKKPFEYLDNIYTSNRQNTRAVEIEVV